MPTYHYRCGRCSERFESHHGMSAGVPPCPYCGGVAARILTAAPAVHGYLARGRELAARSLKPRTGAPHGPGCPCCH